MSSRLLIEGKATELRRGDIIRVHRCEGKVSFSRQGKQIMFPGNRELGGLLWLFKEPSREESDMIARIFSGLVQLNYQLLLEDGCYSVFQLI